MDKHQKFVEDMEKASVEVDEEYHGRFFYRGPAVRTSERDWPTLQDVIRATDVPVQWDNMGLDYVVYPK